ncbi:MAG: hypothetical protein AAB652_02760 [Patescibacteria group bacterium]
MAIDQRLKKYFWDTDFNALDRKKHKRYIIERILEMGDEPAAAWMRQTFSKDDIIKVLNATRNISKRSMHFWHLVLDRSV